MSAVGDWEAQGKRHTIGGSEIFVVDLPADHEHAEPVLLIHGFPTSSFDWRALVPSLTQRRRVVMLDLLGFGLSDKPDQPYSLFAQADIVEAVMRDAGIERCALVTHDMGDSVGGELLARALEGSLGFEVTKRVITNGSVYMDLVQLSPGQELLLALPDEKLDAEFGDLVVLSESLRAICGPDTPLSDEEARAQYELIAREQGTRLLPRLIRYIGERRVHEGRWTGAIERHPSPLAIVWGDADPIAVFPMAERLAQRRPDAALVRLRAIGHFPMIEAPDAVAGAIALALA